MAKLKTNLFLLCLTAIIVRFIQPCWSYREISGLLDEASDLSHKEINTLGPLFAELQLQYDYLVNKALEYDVTKDEQQEHIYEFTLKEFEQQISNMFPLEATTLYNTTLPSVEEIMGKPDFNQMTKEQQLEFLDMQSILQDAIDDAQVNLNALVTRALMLERNLLKIDKPKIVVIILKAVGLVYNVAARVAHAAYCTYSHVPQLNASLHYLYEGVDCHLYITSLIVQIQNETHQTVKTVKKDIYGLAAVYKKIADKNSLMGKIVSGILNVTKIVRSLLDTVSTAKHALDRVENQLPVAAQKMANCGKHFAPKIPYMIDSVSKVIECIVFVDDTIINYDFMKPEEEYNKEPYSIVSAIDGDKNVMELDDSK